MGVEHGPGDTRSIVRAASRQRLLLASSGFLVEGFQGLLLAAEETLEA